MGEGGRREGEEGETWEIMAVQLCGGATFFGWRWSGGTISVRLIGMQRSRNTEIRGYHDTHDANLGTSYEEANARIEALGVERRSTHDDLLDFNVLY